MNKYSVIIQVCEVGNISKAAMQLNYSQPAVSRVIASVENELGFPLFKRLKTGVVLTEDGKKILPAFQDIAREEQKLRQIALSITGLYEGRLSVGSIPGVSRQWFPDIIKDFSKRYPGVTYEFIQCPTDEIQEELCEGRIDCGFTASYPSNNELDFTPVRKDEFLIVIPKGHPLEEKKQIEIEEIAQTPLIVAENALDAGLMDAFSSRGVIPDIYMRGRDEISLVRMIENGLGIGVFPELDLSGISVPKKAVIRRFREHYGRVVGISVRKNQKQPLLTEKFIEFVHTYIGRKQL